jgi:hypothetical protein
MCFFRYDSFGVAVCTCKDLFGGLGSQANLTVSGVNT